MSLKTHLVEAASLLNASATDALEEKMARAVEAIATALAQNKVLLVGGNGGSASDALHIAGELVAQFTKKRRALKAICLGANMAALTAWANDYSYDVVYSRIIEGIGQQGDVLVGLSTSGNSKNIIKAFEKGREKNMATVGFTGENGGAMKSCSDYLINIPSADTPRIQESHIMAGHIICQLVEEKYFR